MREERIWASTSRPSGTRRFGFEGFTCSPSSRCSGRFIQMRVHSDLSAQALDWYTISLTRKFQL